MHVFAKLVFGKISELLFAVAIAAKHTRTLVVLAGELDKSSTRDWMTGGVWRFTAML